MTINWQAKYSTRADSLFGSMTRALMHLLADPEVISFGGGIPAPEFLPVRQVKDITNWILDNCGPDALQYGTTEGYPPLRRYLVERYNAIGFELAEEDVIITSGSQQGIDLIAKLFIDRGDVVVLEDPTFLTALQAFGAFQARYLTVPIDDQGMQVDSLPEILEKNQVKFIYTIPNFQNPTGVTLSLERRKKLVDIAGHYGIPIIEDDPYGELRFSGQALPSLKSMDRGQNVIYLSSFSKILSPGLRVAALVAPRGVMEKLVFAKQAADLHTSTLAQMVAYEFFHRGLLPAHLAAINEVYRSRRDAMLRAMETNFPEGVAWTRPEGGFFVWVTLPPRMNTTELFADAVAEKVVYVPGSHYFANGGGENTMRLNFSACNEERIDLGMQRLGRVVSRKW
ncbi:MAG: PLP-dependent aminotransferase family protein [Dehalococcoidales bacterium]|nr:PLP-dependent aminotransferase family protein [Dehalococcoidales bacterium]